MPISGGKYVAPTWNNGASPAIDASELQAMSDGIETSFKGAVFESGTYLGTGTYGSGNPTGITCSRQPRILWVGAIPIFGRAAYLDKCVNVEGFLVRNGDSSVGITLTTSTSPPWSGYVNLTWSVGGDVKKVNWYSPGGPAAQMNKSGVTYYWFAITQNA